MERTKIAKIKSDTIGVLEEAVSIKKLNAFCWRQRFKGQSGQTLIETIVAVFVLATALTSALGMSIFALNSSISARNYVIASNLAREGVDVVRMMRDTNWLSAGAAGPPSACADIGSRPCYPTAFSGPTFNLNLPDNGALGNDFYRMRFTPATRTWVADRRNGNETYFLCLMADGTYAHNDTGGSGIICGGSQFARRVRLATRQGTAFEYSLTDPDNQEVIVQSIVQWSGKNCPVIPSNITNTPARCKVIVEERLTNWKDYR
jgi:hypothetical protein